MIKGSKLEDPLRRRPGKRESGSDLIAMDIERDQLETRIATLERMLVTERARPKPSEHKIADLEKELTLARRPLEKLDQKEA